MYTLLDENFIDVIKNRSSSKLRILSRFQMRLYRSFIHSYKYILLYIYKTQLITEKY